MKLLTICIPTFNRSHYAMAQLDYIKVELGDLFNEVDIKVADNCSSAEHQKQLQDYQAAHRFFDLLLNDQNLGLIGNIFRLLATVETPYVWFVGDDDVLLPGAIQRALSIIKFNKPDYIFMNFNAFYDNVDNILSKIDLLGYDGVITNGLEFPLRFFKRNGTACMFMTAGIYQTKIIQRIADVKRQPLITDPLLFFFTASKSNAYLEKEVFVLDRLAGISWKSEERDVFSWKVPESILEAITVADYPDDAIADILFDYYKREKNYLIMFATAPSPVRKKIVSLLGKRNFTLTALSASYLCGVVFRKLTAKKESV
jgi:glycosyltransferase involved in cell wall biosynthesis